MTKKELLSKIEALEQRVLDLENLNIFKVLPILESVEPFRPFFTGTKPTPYNVSCGCDGCGGYHGCAEPFPSDERLPN